MATRVRLSARVRRSQILRSAIAVLAESGFRAATYARIAEHAGLSSTGLISYHFEDRDELMREVVDEVLQQLDDYVRPRMDAQTSPSAALREYIVASIEFYARFPQEIAALDAVRHDMKRPDGRLEFGSDVYEPEIVRLQRLMSQAQVLGEMTSFCTRVVAVSLHRILDGAAREVLAGHAEPARYAAEVVRLFAAGTAKREDTP